MVPDTNLTFTCQDERLTKAQQWWLIFRQKTELLFYYNFLSDLGLNFRQPSNSPDQPITKIKIIPNTYCSGMALRHPLLLQGWTNSNCLVIKRTSHSVQTRYLGSTLTKHHTSPDFPTRISSQLEAWTGKSDKPSFGGQPGIGTTQVKVTGRGGGLNKRK